MRRVLVIGGNLFIGRELVTRLLDRGDEVTILHRGNNNPFRQKTLEIHCDRNDTAAMEKVLQERNFEYVFDNVYDWQRGTTGKQVSSTAKACSPVLKRYVYMSSCAVYVDGLDRTEDSLLAGPACPEHYCLNKADSERELFKLHASQGLSVVTLRPPFIYGPLNPFYREAYFWDRLRAGRPILIPGDGSRLMQFVSVMDLAEAALRAAESPEADGKAYNIAHPAAVRQDEFVRTLADAAGIEPDLHYVGRDRLQQLGGGIFEPPYYFGQYFDMPPITMDVSQAEKDLNFSPMTLSDGMRQTWNWYSNGDQSEVAVPNFSYEDQVLAVIKD